MSELKSAKTAYPATVCKTDGNPEGKGLSGFLHDWCEIEPRGVVAKPRRQILAEFFTSMLVLSAKFKFRPTVGSEYYLYFINDQWTLSLIAPYEWSDERRAAFAGTCVLHRDMTWTITPSDMLAEEGSVSIAMGRYFAAFAGKLDTDRAFEEILPFYAGGLPYYQRLYASAVSRSLRAAIILGDQAATGCRQWFRSLPERRSMLLDYMG